MKNVVIKFKVFSELPRGRARFISLGVSFGFRALGFIMLWWLRKVMGSVGQCDFRLCQGMRLRIDKTLCLVIEPVEIVKRGVKSLSVVR